MKSRPFPIFGSAELLKFIFLIKLNITSKIFLIPQLFVLFLDLTSANTL